MTLKQLRTLLRENGVEYYIKKDRGTVAKIHVLLDEEETNVVGN